MKKDKLTLQEQTTINYYNTNAHEWSDKHSSESYFSKDLERFFELLPKGRVLEVGSGHGGEAMKLTGHFGVENYVGVDASKGLLKIAKSRNPGAKFLNRNIYELGFPKDFFNGFWVSAMLVHIPKSRLNEALENLHKVTKTNGVGFISIMEGESDMDEARPGRFFTLWKQDEFEAELKTAGFKIIYKRRREPEQSQSPWLAYIVQKQ